MYHYQSRIQSHTEAVGWLKTAVVTCDAKDTILPVFGLAPCIYQKRHGQFRIHILSWQVSYWVYHLHTCYLLTCTLFLGHFDCVQCPTLEWQEHASEARFPWRQTAQMLNVAGAQYHGATTKPIGHTYIYVSYLLLIASWCPSFSRTLHQHLLCSSRFCWQVICFWMFHRHSFVEQRCLDLLGLVWPLYTLQFNSTC